MPEPQLMPEPQCFVTYAVMTEEAGANPFWHSFIMMSKQKDGQDSPIEVEHAFGFYSSSPSSTTNPVIKFLKDQLGFKMDLQDSHGHLENEKMRHLESSGIRGISFDVSKEKYNTLLENYKTAKALEQEAINEYNKEILQNNEKNKPANGHTRWLEEKKHRAKDSNNTPRLFPFHIDWGFSWNFNEFGFFTNNSYTCKSHALNMLRAAKIIDEEIVNSILGTPAGYAFPRYSGLHLPPMQFVSTGNRVKSEKPCHTGEKKVYYSRAWENKNQLFWTQTPRTLKTVLNNNALQNEAYALLRKTLKQADKIELLLLKRMEVNNPNDASTSSNNLECQDHLQSIMEIKESLKANTQNQETSQLDSAIKALKKALQRLNYIRIALTPDNNILNYIIHNVALHEALMGLLTIIAAANFLNGTAAVAIIVTAGVYSTYKFYKAVETEFENIEVIQDYRDFKLSSQATTRVRQRSSDDWDQRSGNDWEMSSSPQTI